MIGSKNPMINLIPTSSLAMNDEFDIYLKIVTVYK